MGVEFSEKNGSRIGCACWYRTVGITAVRVATLLAWTIDSEDGAIYPAAILEDHDSHQVVVRPAQFVSFKAG